MVKRGRHEHQPTAATRQLAMTRALNNVPQSRIAEHVGVDPNTLRKHYRREIDFGAEHCCAIAGNSLLSTSARVGTMVSVAAAKFILCCKGGWVRALEI
jgi:hypothetical protein